MSSACLGKPARVAALSIAIAVQIGLAMPAVAFTGADEPSVSDVPAAMNLSPRGGDGLRIDIPGGVTNAAGCGEDAQRASTASRACSHSQAINALGAAGVRSEPGTRGQGVR